MRDESKGKKREDDEDGRHPLAFAPGTNAKRRTESSPRRTSLHRRTEGHGVYFCRVAAAVAGQKACGFHPGPRASLFLSIPVSLSFSFLSSRFSPHFPLRPTLSSVPTHHLLFFPFATAVSLAPFFSSRYASFYATAQPRSSLSRARFSLYPTRAVSPVSFSPFLHSSSTASPAPERNHLRRFFADAPRLSSSSTCKPIAHASERTRRSESRRERGSEIERERRNPNTVYTSERKRAAGEPAREKERRRGTRGGMYRRRAMGYAAGGKRKRKERSGGC